MKVKILQRSVYYKTAEVEIDIDMNVYDHWRLDNGKYADIGDYLIEAESTIIQTLLENEDLWSDKIDEAISESPIGFGFGMDSGDWTDKDQDSEWRYECDELKIGGHL